MSWCNRSIYSSCGHSLSKTEALRHLSLRLWGLAGWNPNMEWCDILHAVWLGVGRDLCGSLLMQVATHGDFAETSYDGRLRALHAKCQAWCSRNSIRPSTIEEVSLLHAYC